MFFTLSTYAFSLTEEKSMLFIVDAFEKIWQDNDQKRESLEKFALLLENAYSKVNPDKIDIIIFLENEVARRIQKYNDLASQPITIYPETTQARLQRHNNVRENPLSLDPKLMQTAQERAEYLAKNTIAAANVHKRSPEDGYYDYSIIKQRFADHNVSFINDSGITFSESVAYEYVKCPDDNCDKELLEATKKARQFLYESEKARSWVHYRAIIQPRFQKIGIGIAINKETNRYYIVLHYGTEIENKE